MRSQDRQSLLCVHAKKKGAHPYLHGSKSSGRTWGAPLAAAVLATAFQDLESPHNTKYIYAQFFFSDLCKFYFDVAGVVYDEKKIIRKLQNRPTQNFSQDLKTKHGIYDIEVKNGYIWKITNRITGEICRLNYSGSEPNYYYPFAISSLKRGRYWISEGV